MIRAGPFRHATGVPPTTGRRRPRARRSGRCGPGGGHRRTASTSHTSRIASANPSPTTRAPSPATFASLCARGEPRRVQVVDQRGPDAAHLVRRDLLALAGPADDDPALGLARHHRATDGGAERGVVDRLGRVGAEVEHVVALRREERDEVRLEREAGMVRTDRDLHRANIRTRAGDGCPRKSSDSAPRDVGATATVRPTLTSRRPAVRPEGPSRGGSGGP